MASGGGGQQDGSQMGGGTNKKNPTYDQAGAQDKDKQGGANKYQITVIKTGKGKNTKTYKATTEKETTGKGKKKKTTTILKVGGLQYDISGMTDKQLKALEKQIKSQLKDYEKMGVKPTTDKKGNLILNTTGGTVKGKNNANKTVSKIASKMVTTYLNVEGMPYQFMSNVDPRFYVGKLKKGRASAPENDGNKTIYGRKYAEKVISRMPLVFFTPVKPIFMDDFSKSDVKTALQALVTGAALEPSLLESNGRYYSVKFDYSTYYRYLNILMHTMAVYLNIHDKKYKVPGCGSEQSIGSINWQNDNSSAFKTFYSSAENIIFYADGLNQVTESFSNETMESSIASTINGFADQMKEINQLVGGTAKSVINMAGDVSDWITDALKPIVGKLGGGILGSLAEYGVDTVLSGGKIIFPKIWSNSTHNTSYSINFKLRSPDHDTLSLYLNILKPYAKLLALTLPRAIDGNPNAYNAPFLVKVACKGMVNIDMGIISSISFTKGNECQWNDDGIPSEIDVSVEIEDLYTSVIAMSGVSSDPDIITGKSALEMVQNTAYMDYIANLCGLNIAQMEIGRKVQMWYYLTKAGATGILTRIGTAFDETVSGLIDNLYRALS